MLIAVLAALPVLVPAIQDIHDLATGKWNPKEKQAPAPTADDLPFIGPGLPADQTKADCVLKAASAVGLNWTAKGWRTSEIDEPSLVGDPAKVRAEIAFFGRRMETYVGSRQNEWKKCLEDQPPPVDATTTSEPAPEIAGNYTLQFHGTTSDPYCQAFTMPTTMRIGLAGGSDISITTNSTAASDQLNGSVDRGYGFSANGTRQVGGGLGLRMLGRFEATGTETLINNGSLTFSADQQCDFTFTATRTGA